MDLGSHIDAPQKPNCRSPVQGLEQQGLRRHLPSRSSVRAELRDGNSSFATKLWSECSLYLYQRDESLLFILVDGEERRGRDFLLAAEETGIWKGFHVELKLPQLLIETPADNELKLPHNWVETPVPSACHSNSWTSNLVQYILSIITHHRVYWFIKSK